MPRNAVAIHVAKKVVKYARDLRYPNSEMLECTDCRLFPVLPVTGYCGHTRCTKCIERNGSCFCGCLPPKSRHINILVQRLVDKMLPPELRQPVGSEQSTMPSTSTGRPEIARLRPKSLGSLRHHKKRCREHPYSAPLARNPRHRFFPNPEVQYKYALGLVAGGRYRDAAPHLAHVAASKASVARKALDLLIQSVGELVKSIERHRLTRELYRAVRAYSPAAWLEPADLECVICYQMLDRPVTTPCGHTFCRECILRTLDDNKRCAMCRRSLDNLTIVLTADTSFVTAALLAVAPIPPSPLESEGMLIPIFKCTVAFPTVPCPILILGPSHWVIIRRILDSGNRRVGMVTTYRDGSLAICGTIVEVRDCVQLEDGQTILSTVGIARFQTLGQCCEEDCHIARVVELKDIIPTAEEVANMKLERMAEDITDKAMVWLSTLSSSLLSDIEEAFGPMPLCCDEEQWWENPHCPKWLWWIVAILPLRPEIQVLMISTSSLHKRMMAVSRTLDVMSHMSVNFNF